MGLVLAGRGEGEVEAHGDLARLHLRRLEDILHLELVLLLLLVGVVREIQLDLRKSNLPPLHHEPLLIFRTPILACVGILVLVLTVFAPGLGVCRLFGSFQLVGPWVRRELPSKMLMLKESRS